MCRDFGCEGIGNEGHLYFFLKIAGTRCALYSPVWGIYAIDYVDLLVEEACNSLGGQVDRAPKFARTGRNSNIC